MIASGGIGLASLHGLIGYLQRRLQAAGVLYPAGGRFFFVTGSPERLPEVGEPPGGASQRSATISPKPPGDFGPGLFIRVVLIKYLANGESSPVRTGAIGVT